MDITIHNTNELSILKDPFFTDKIERIMVVTTKGIFDGKPYSYGTVEFKNGDTKGEQKFEATSFDEVCIKIKEFLETLKK